MISKIVNLKIKKNYNSYIYVNVLLQTPVALTRF